MLQRLDAMVKCGWWNSEPRRSPGPPGDTAPARGERRFDDLPFAARARLETAPMPQPEVVVEPIALDSHDSSTANTSPELRDHGPLDHVLQLTDVAWPVVGLQQLQRLLVD